MGICRSIAFCLLMISIVSKSFCSDNLLFISSFELGENGWSAFRLNNKPRHDKFIDMISSWQVEGDGGYQGSNGFSFMKQDDPEFAKTVLCSHDFWVERTRNIRYRSGPALLLLTPVSVIMFFLRSGWCSVIRTARFCRTLSSAIAEKTWSAQQERGELNWRSTGNGTVSVLFRKKGLRFMRHGLKSQRNPDRCNLIVFRFRKAN